MIGNETCAGVLRNTIVHVHFNFADRIDSAGLLTILITQILVFLFLSAAFAYVKPCSALECYPSNLGNQSQK